MITTTKTSTSVRSNAPAMDPITAFWYAMGWTLIAVGLLLGFIAIAR